MSSAAQREPAIVQRTFSIDELQSLDRCLACDAVATTGGVRADVAEGAIVELDEDLPTLRLCAGCAHAHREGRRWGERAAIALSIAAPAAPLLASIATPTEGPWCVAAAAFMALSAARALDRIAHQRRGSACRALVVDGEGRDVTVQVALMHDDRRAPAAGVYRRAASDRAPGGIPARAYPPRRTFPWTFAAATMGTGLAALVGWYGGYPLVVIDAPKEAAWVYVDGVKTPLHVPAGRQRELPLRFGAHHFEVVPEVGPTRRFDAYLPWGTNHLLPVDLERCYELSGANGGPGRTARGAWLSIDAHAAVRRSACTFPAGF